MNCKQFVAKAIIIFNDMSYNIKGREGIAFGEEWSQQALRYRPMSATQCPTNAQRNRLSESSFA